jgi:hypothetical protein
VGSRVEWNARLVDADQRGWPTAASRSVPLRFSGPPRGFSRGLIAKTPGLSIAWGDDGQIGEERTVNATLDADWLNPRFPCVLTGVIQSLYLAVPVPQEPGSEGPTPIRLVEAYDLSGPFAGFPGSSEAPVGFFAYLDVEAVSIG